MRGTNIYCLCEPPNSVKWREKGAINGTILSFSAYDRVWLLSQARELFIRVYFAETNLHNSRWKLMNSPFKGLIDVSSQHPLRQTTMFLPWNPFIFQRMSHNPYPISCFYHRARNIYWSACCQTPGCPIRARSVYMRNIAFDRIRISGHIVSGLPPLPIPNDSNFPNSYRREMVGHRNVLASFH